MRLNKCYFIVNIVASLIVTLINFMIIFNVIVYVQSYKVHVDLNTDFILDVHGVLNIEINIR